MADWLESLAQVAGVAGKLITGFLAAEDDAETSVDTGDIEWSYIQQSGKPAIVLAKNTSDLPVGLTYTLSRKNENLSIHQPLDPGNSYDATADIDDFLEGNVSAAPTVSEEAAAGPGARTVSFAISALSLGTAVAVIKGVTLSYDRSPTGFTASLKSDTVTPLSAEIRARDFAGNSVSAGLKIGSVAEQNGGGVFEIPLPSGVDLNPVAAQLNLSLELPVAAYEQATRERGARQLTGAPLG
jgi:hypothetical protein